MTKAVISNYTKQLLQNIFSVTNKNAHKIIRIFGIKFKFKNKKNTERKQIRKLKNLVLKQNSEIESLTNKLKKINNEILNLDNTTLKICQAPEITELAMLKTKYNWDNIKIPVIKNNSETIEELKNTDKSIIRFGDGEFSIMEGESICFQKYDPSLAEKLKEIIKNNDDNLLIGIPEPYYDYPLNINKNYLMYILNWHSKWHKVMEHYFNYDKIYYSNHISRVFPVYDEYDFEKHFCGLRAIWDNKSIVIITGNRVYNNIEYNIFDNAAEVEYIYGPTENAFSEYDNLKNQILNIPKDKILVFALGPAGKVLAYDMYNAGYRTLDLGHTIKDYDLYKKSSKMTQHELDKNRLLFFYKD